MAAKGKGPGSKAKKGPARSGALSRKKDGTLTRAAKRDMRDAAALGISAMSLGVSVASLLIPLLNTRPEEDPDDHLVSEGYGPF